MADLAFTRSDILAILRLDSTAARKHARCGPKARCRRDAIAKCDEDLDLLLEAEPVDLPGLRPSKSSADAR